MKTGTIIFFTGFLLTISIIAAYIIALIVDVTIFTAWIMSMTVCGLVLLGSVMMLVGRALERRSSDLK